METTFCLLLILVYPSAKYAYKGPVIDGCRHEWPCEPDWYCSKATDTCRPCSHIASHYCLNRSHILHNFEECDAYCAQYRTEQKLHDVELLLENRTAEVKELQKAVQHPETVCKGEGGYTAWYSYLLPVVTCAAGVLVTSLIMVLKNKAQKRESQEGEEPQTEEAVSLTESNANTDLVTALSDHNETEHDRYHPHGPPHESNPIQHVHQRSTEGDASQNSFLKEFVSA